MTIQYEKSWVAVDAVIFTIIDGKLYCYLNKREKEPFSGKYELLGGLMLPNETADETMTRKLQETLDYITIYFQEFSVFTQVDRDPRSRAVSIGYIALVHPDNIPNKQDWHSFETLPKLAFDHTTIIKHAFAFLQQNLNVLIVKQFMPKHFALNDLQRVYEIIEQKKYDNRNFRKKILLSGIVKQTQFKEDKVSHRPATMYTFTN